MRRTLQSLKRTPYQTAAALLVLYFTLFLIGILIISVTFLYGLLKYVEAQPQVTVYFKSDTKESEILQIQQELEASKKVSSTEYISKEKAYEIYKELTKDNPLLLEMSSKEILPASLEIYATDPTYLEEIADSLRERKGVDEVQFQKIIVDRLLTLTNAVRNATLVLCAFLILMATIVVIATTSFKIALRKVEIEILQLLGASNFFITKPYLKEGLVMGFLASLLSTFSLIGLILFVNPLLQGYLRGIPSINYTFFGTVTLQIWPFNVLFFALVFAITAVFGIGIGLFANMLASRRYLS
jgi:cell division transport system permease protein